MNESNLHNYQRTAVEHILQVPKSGLFLDMGLGKTVSTLTAINRLVFEELEVDRVFIIAPKRVATSVWTNELTKWSHLSGLSISRVIGNEKQRKAALAQKAHIYTIGRDNVVWLCGLYGGSMIPADMLIIDESSSFKNPQSMRFKALRRVIASVSRVVLLTGTPAPNGLIDLWSQVYLLDKGERLGKTLTSYRENYFTPGKRNGMVVFNYDIRKDGEELIHQQISDICISMKAKDYLDLPPRIDNYIEVDFDDALHKKYTNFEREMVLELFASDKEITAVNSAALSNKLLQFANGAVYDENKDYHTMHDLKLDAVEEIIENANGKPVLIAWTYRHDLERMLVRLKKYSPRSLKTEQDERDWNAKKINVLLMHPASGGHGLNLQAGGNIIVWFGPTWSLELYQQFNARLDRQGQTESTIVNHIIAKGTIDNDVIKSLASKDAKQEGLLKAVKARIDKYLKNNF